MSTTSHTNLILRRSFKKMRISESGNDPGDSDSNNESEAVVSRRTPSAKKQLFSKSLDSGSSNNNKKPASKGGATPLAPKRNKDFSPKISIEQLLDPNFLVANQRPDHHGQDQNPKTPHKDSAKKSGVFKTDNNSNTMSVASKNHIGRWGEAYAYRQIMDYYCKGGKHLRYKDSIFFEAPDQTGFELRDQSKTLMLTVSWPNKALPLNEDAGKEFDIQVEKYRDGQLHKTKYIEVKATTSANKTQFTMSGDEWQFLKKHRNNYSFFRVFNSGTEKAYGHAIKKPLEAIESGTDKKETKVVKISFDM